MAERSQAHDHVRGLSLALIVGLSLIGLHLLGRVLAPAAPEEAHRALLRLRGSLVLVAVAWYGRYVLLPRARWLAVRWIAPPALALLALARWPFIGASRWLSLLWGAVLIGLYLSLAEQLGAVLRQIGRLNLASLQARDAATFIARRAAGNACFLVALAAGVSLYLLAVDYLFDYLLYSLFGAVLAVAAYLGPLAILAARLERAIAAGLLEAAGRMDAALAEHSPAALAGEERIRRILRRSGRLGLTWWHWLHPLASSALLLLAALLYQW